MRNVRCQVIRDAGDSCKQNLQKCCGVETPDAPHDSFCILLCVCVCVLMQCDEHGQVRERPQGDSQPGDPESEMARLLSITVSSCSRIIP